MVRPFKLLVFDWDGTLMDSATTIVHAMQAACRDLSLPVPTDDQARHVIGLGLHDALFYLLPELDSAEYPRLGERYGYHYMRTEDTTLLFPGTAEALRQLRSEGYLLAVATGKGRRGLDRVLERTGLRDAFDATRCSDEAFSKPHPAMLNDLLDMLDVTPEAALMIGDTTHDLEMARNAGVAGAGVAYGAHPRAALEALQPVVCVNQPHELWQWLMPHN
jgi:phosphoglycolate phosphatase